MKPIKKWAPKQFLAYVLLYAAHANIHYKKEEKDHILSKVGDDAYQEAYEEFVQDNSYVQLRKILIHQIEHDDYSPGTVIEEIQEVCLVDNQFHRMEQYMLSMVKGLFNRTFLKSQFQKLT